MSSIDFAVRLLAQDLASPSMRGFASTLGELVTASSAFARALVGDVEVAQSFTAAVESARARVQAADAALLTARTNVASYAVAVQTARGAVLSNQLAVDSAKASTTGYAAAVKSAQSAVVAAQEAVLTATGAYRADNLALRDAQVTLRDVQIAWKDFQLDATAAATAAGMSVTDYRDKLQKDMLEAQRDVMIATQSQETSFRGLKAAEDDLAINQQILRQANDDYRVSQGAVTTATNGLTVAQRDLTVATQAMQAEQLTASAASRDLKQAQLDLSTANQTLAAETEAAAARQQTAIAGVRSQFLLLGGAVAGAGLAFAAFAIPTKIAFDNATSLEQALLRVKFATQSTSDAMPVLTNAINDLAVKTVYGSTEAAGSFELLAEKGFTVSQILYGTSAAADEYKKHAYDATEATNGLGAQALYLGQALKATATDGAELLAAALNEFKDQSLTAKQAANDLAGAYLNGVPDASALRTAIAQAGAQADTAGISFKDFLTTLDLLTQAGISASSAGSSLNYMIQSLIAPTQKQAQELASLGIMTIKTGQAYDDFRAKLVATGAATQSDITLWSGSVKGLHDMFTAAQKAGEIPLDENFNSWALQAGLLSNHLFDASGKFIGMKGAIETLDTAMKGMSVEEKMAVLSDLFNIRSGRAARVLTNLGEFSQQYDQIFQRIGKTDVTQLASDQLKTLAGAAESLKDSMTSALAVAVLPMLQVLSGFLGTINDLVQKFLTLPQPIQLAFGAFLVFGTIISGAAFIIIGLIVGVTMLVGVLGGLAPVVAVVAAVFIALVEIAAALIPVFMVVFTLFDRMRPMFADLYQEFLSKVKPLFDQAQSGLGQLLAKVKEAWDSNWPDIRNAMLELGASLHDLLPYIVDAIKIAAASVLIFAEAVIEGAILAINVIAGVIRIFAALIEWGARVATFFDDLIHGRWDRLWNDWRAMTEAAFLSVERMLFGFVDTALNATATVFDALSKLPGPMADSYHQFAEGLRAYMADWGQQMTQQSKDLGIQNGGAWAAGLNLGIKQKPIEVPPPSFDKWKDVPGFIEILNKANEGYYTEIEKVLAAHNLAYDEMTVAVNIWYGQQRTILNNASANERNYVQQVRQNGRDAVNADNDTAQKRQLIWWDYLQTRIGNASYEKRMTVQLANQQRQELLQQYILMAQDAGSQSSKAATAIIAQFTRARDTGNSLGQQLRKDIRDALSAMPSEDGAAAGRAANMIIAPFKHDADLAYGIGKNIMDSLAAGIAAEAGAAAGAAARAAAETDQAFKDYFGIHSPSRLFDYYGQMTMAGFAQGVTTGSRGATEAMTTALRNVTTPGLSSLSLSMQSAANAASRQSGPLQPIQLIVDGKVLWEATVDYGTGRAQMLGLNRVGR